SSSGLGNCQPALVSTFSVMYSSPHTAPSGAYAATVVLGLMLAWTTPFVRYAVTTFRTPPSVMSLEWTVAFVPSSNVITATAQSSTSSARVGMDSRRPTRWGGRVGWAASGTAPQFRSGAASIVSRGSVASQKAPVSGFSTITCLPARAAAIATSWWVSVVEQMSTTSTSGDATSSR